MSINFKDSILNYQYIIKTKDDIISNMEEMEEKLKLTPSKFIPMSYLSFSARFSLKYSYSFE